MQEKKIDIKLGEVVEVGESIYVIREVPADELTSICIKCIFDDNSTCMDYACRPNERKDGYDVYFDKISPINKSKLLVKRESGDIFLVDKAQLKKVNAN